MSEKRDAAWATHRCRVENGSAGWQDIIQQAIDAAVAEMLQTAHEAYESLGETLEVTRKEYDARLAAANETIKRLRDIVANLCAELESGPDLRDRAIASAALALVPSEPPA